ncbi:protein bassoon-like [Tribolium madens]|uniref:protein bassoon-like n=1 Tax=Tribolium madens TaxID=41895 RepID=UPI001CF756A8|nr:protein bassoon-like [Tribolium madens]
MTPPGKVPDVKPLPRKGSRGPCSEVNSAPRRCPGIIIDLLTPAPEKTPAGQKEFEEMLLGLGEDFTILDEWEEIFTNVEEPKIIVHQDKVIKPAMNTIPAPTPAPAPGQPTKGIGAGRKNLNLIRVEVDKEEETEETQQQPTQPEMEFRQLVEEEYFRVELRGIKRKLEEKAERLKRNRSFAQEILKNLNTEEEEVMARMNRELAQIKKRRQAITSILEKQVEEERICDTSINNINF